MSATHVLDWTRDQWQAWFAERGWPAYRADQVRRWIFVRRAESFAEMTDLPKKLREQMTAELTLWSMQTAVKHVTEDGTEKLLLECADHQKIECVLIRQDVRRTVCVSTQVGCAMGCVFCASGLEGVARNLTTGEILEQLLRVQRLLPAADRLSHIVVMGMGEPLANLERLLPALSEATADDGLGIGARRITISTVGLPPGLRQLAERQVPYHLAVSLHAPDDALRNRLVKVNQKTGLDAILAAADQFFEVTGRRVTYEYVLLADENDQPPHARRLAELLRGRNALVNLIPYNPVTGLPYRTPRDENVRRFVEILEAAGVQTRVRKRKGDRINAACGQLRRTPVPVPIAEALHGDTRSL